jgi:hypothetical protein
LAVLLTHIFDVPVLFGREGGGTLSEMERTAWTDERLDDFAGHVDQRFDQVDQRFDRLEGDVRELRAELRTGLGGLRVEIDNLRLRMIRFGGAMIATMMAGWVGVIGAVPATG